MANRVNNSLQGQLIAAELSQAAYAPFIDFYDGATSYVDDVTHQRLPLPNGWHVDLSDHRSVNIGGINQFITFVNPSEHQIVIAFKGSDAPSNFISDLANDGHKEYADIHAAADAALTSIRGNAAYSGYTIYTDGHSLGGGMAQTFSVENNLSGFGQNALPIAAGSIADDAANFDAQLNTFASDATFTETNTVGDIATGYYTARIENGANDAYIYNRPSGLVPTIFTQDIAKGIQAVNYAMAHPGDTDPLTSVYAGAGVASFNAILAHGLGNVVGGLKDIINRTDAFIPNIPLAATANLMQYLAASANTDAPNQSGMFALTPDDFSQFVWGTPVISGGVVTEDGTAASGSNIPFSSLSVSLFQSPSNEMDLKANLTNGTSYETTFVDDPDGSASIVTNDYAEPNQQGDVIFAVTTEIPKNGQTTISISGRGDITTGMNAAITLADNTSVGIGGTGNKITLGNNNSLNLFSANNTIVGGGVTLDAGTYLGQSISTADNTLTTELVDADGDDLGLLAYNMASNTGTVTLEDGQSFSIGTSAGEVKAASIGTPPEEVLADYLSKLQGTDDNGNAVSGTASLIAANFNHFNPAADPDDDYTVSGEETDNGDGTFTDTFTLTSTLPGAQINGDDDINILVTGANDLVQDGISGIQQLSFGGSVTLTNDEWSGFTGQNVGGVGDEDGPVTYGITGGGTIVAADGGTWDLTDPRVNPLGTYNLTAQGWDDTTLIGNDQNNQTLTASLFGDDTLFGGNGTGDILYAGEGVDSLEGGAGGDTQFWAADGLASGSSVTGNSDTDILFASGDISGAIVAGVNMLEGATLYAPVTLSNAEFQEFTSIATPGITAADGGVYDARDKFIDLLGGLSLTAISDQATTLIGADYGTSDTTYISGLTAAGDGNYTLEAGDLSDELDVTGNGNNQLIAGDGHDSFTISGNGDNTVDAGGGSDIFTVSGNGDNSISAGNGAGESLTITGSGQNVVSLGDGAGNNVHASGGTSTITVGSGNDALIEVTTAGNTITVGNGTGDIISAQGGGNTMSGGSGGVIFELYGDDNTVNGGSGNDTIRLYGDGTAVSVAGSTINGGGGADSIVEEVPGDLDLTAATVTGIESITTSSLTVNADQLAALTSLQTVTLNAASAGTYSVASIDTGNFVTMVDVSENGGVTLIDNNFTLDVLTTTRDNDTLVSGNGSHDTISATGSGETVTAGTGSNDSITLGSNSTATINGASAATTLNGVDNTVNIVGSSSTVTDSGAGGNTFVVGGTSTTGATINGKGADIYTFVSTFGQDTINNGNSGGSNPLGQVLFSSGITDQNLWFVQSGNNLQIDLLGTTERVTVNGWFSSNGSQVEGVTLSNGTQLSAANVSSLVSAMATYQAANPSFDPTTGSMPSDTTLQAALSSAWNSAVNVANSAAMVVAQLDYLQTLAAASQLGTITLTDSGTPTLTISSAQLTSDSGALAAIVSSYNLAVSGVAAANAAIVAAGANVTSVAVSDTAANIAANLDDLQTLAAASGLASITLTDGTLLTVTGTQFTNDADALALLATGTDLEVTGVAAAAAATVAANTNVVLIAVSDTAANVTTNISALETLAATGELESIAFTDTGTPALSFSAAAAAASIDALASFTGAYTLGISDTAANVAANIAALGALANIGALTSISLTDSGTPTLAITADQAANDGAALAAISGSYDVAVSDTGANVAVDLDALQALAGAGVLTSVTLTDSTTPTLSVTADQLTSDAGALAAITGTYHLAVSGVSATSAATVAGTAHVASITVEDTAANVDAHLDALETLASGGSLTAITLTDTSTPTLSLTTTQLTGDVSALDVVFGLYNLAVSGVLVANVATVASTAHVSSIAISDTAANVVANLNELQALAAGGVLASITLTDTGTPVLTLTQAQLALDAGALAAITSSYTVSGTVTAGNALSAAAQPGVTSIAVSDTAAGVNANLDALETLATDGKLASITLINSSTQTLTITASQLAGDADALGLISSSYNLAVTGVLAADAATVATNTHVTSISVSDTAANVATSLNSLQTAFATGKLSTIALTNGGTPTLTITGAQFTGDTGALGKIASAHHLTVTGALTSIATALGSNSHVTSASFSDSAANVSANFGALQSLVTSSKLASGGVSLTDGGTPALSITDAQFTSSTGTSVLSDIPGGAYTLALSAVAYANASNRNGLAKVVSFAIADTASVLATNINNIQTLASGSSKLIGISVTNNTTAVALTYTQWTSDGTAIGLFTGTYHFSVTAVTAAGAASVAANTHATSISVSDTSAHVATSIDSLQTVAAAGQLTTIAVTDGTNTITITAGQAASDYAALAKLSGTYKVGVTDTAANISANFDALQALYAIETTKLTITATDSGTNHVNISAAQAISDAGAIGRFATGTVLTVTDTAANVSANFQTLVSLGTKLGTIVLTDSGTPVLSLTDALYSPNGATLTKISGAYNLALSGVSYANYNTRNGVSNVVSIAIGDNAANLSTNLDLIKTIAVTPSTKLTAISVNNSGTPVTFTYTQLSSDAAALALFTGTYSFNVTAVSIANASTVLATSHVTAVNISDTAANVQSNIDALQTLAAAAQLTGIVLTSGTTMTLNAAKASTDEQAISKITTTYALTVTDTAANVQANLDGLQVLAAAITTKLSAITLTDGGTPGITISAAQGTNDATAIGKITSAHTLTVSDSSANVWTYIAGLVTLGTKLNTIVLTDGGTPNFALTGAQYTTDNPTLAKITSAYTMTVSSALTSIVAALGGNSHVTSFSVVDTSANLGASMDTLEAQSSKITLIASSTNNLTIPVTYTQFTSTDTDAIALFVGTYIFLVSGVLVANVAALASQTHVFAVSISDTATNISAGLDGLQALGTKVQTVTVTDIATNKVAISSAQAASDGGVIAKIGGTSVVAATDTAANVATNIAALQALSTKLATVTVSDIATNKVALSATVAAANTGAVNKITGTANVVVTDTAANVASSIAGLQTVNAELSSIAVSNGATAKVHLTGAQATADSGAINKITGTANVLITDTVANVKTNLAGLETINAEISSIVLSDSGTPVLSITGAQLNSDADAIAKITSAYNETVAADLNTNETLAGTGSVNTISFTSEGQAVNINMSTGAATTVHTGTTFTYNLSNFGKVIGSTSADTLTAGSSGDVLNGDGGADTYVLNASGIDVVAGTYTTLGTNTNTIQNFSVLDGIDINNLTFSGSTLAFSEDASNTFGTLTVTSSTHSTALKLLGQYSTADFQKVSDGGTGTLVTLAATTHQADILAAAQS